MPQPDPSTVEGMTTAIADQLAEQFTERQSRVVELTAGGATVEDAARVNAARGGHGFITEIDL